jgi:hypothetical protein
MNVSLSTVRLCFDHTVHRVTYLLGAKPALGSDSASFSESDCSGWVRWALDRAGLRLPDGSQTQWNWAEQNLHKLAHYSDAETYAKDDPNRLFIAFESDKKSGIGHVWLGWAVDGQMMTFECHGGQVHRGVDSRPWNALANIAAAAYEIPVK